MNDVKPAAENGESTYFVLLVLSCKRLGLFFHTRLAGSATPLSFIIVLNHIEVIGN